MNSLLRGLLVASWLSAFGLLSASCLAAAPILVDTAWLAEHADDPKIVLIDMTLDPFQYRRFHLPGAQYLPPPALTSKDKFGIKRRISDRQLHTLLGRLGITADTHVVIYDDMGGLEAGRLLWELERIGHERASVLNGGLVKWIREERPIAHDVPPQRRAHYRPGAGGRFNEIDLAGILAARDDPSVILLDVRTPEEYVGKPTEQRSGHIPGARLWPWDQAVDFERAFILKDAESIMHSLRQVGVAGRDAKVVLYCRTGHRSAHTYLALRYLGFEQVQMYPASIVEYAKERPTELRRGPAP